jgi:hypothetical protein
MKKKEREQALEKNTRESRHHRFRMNGAHPIRIITEMLQDRVSQLEREMESLRKGL